MTSRFMLGIFICLSMGFAGMQIFLDKKPIGLQINRPLYPQQTIGFIKKYHPLGNILHMPKWGDYLLGAIPEYRVFFDSREIQFDKIQFVAQHMYNFPEMMKEIVEFYAIKTILLASDFFLMPFKKDGPPWSRRETFFPSAEWGVVSYDDTSFLLLRRIPEHHALLRDFEYKYLLPDTPVSFYLKNPIRSRQTDLYFESELKRCRKENPSSKYCFDAEQVWSTKRDIAF